MSCFWLCHFSCFLVSILGALDSVLSDDFCRSTLPLNNKKKTIRFNIAWLKHKKIIITLSRPTHIHYFHIIIILFVQFFGKNITYTQDVRNSPEQKYYSFVGLQRLRGRRKTVVCLGYWSHFCSLTKYFQKRFLRGCRWQRTASATRI